MQKIFITMDNLDLKISEVVNLSVDTDANMKEGMTLNDMFQAKKKNLGLTDRQIQKMLDIDANTLNPILRGTAKQINFINIIKLAHFLGLSITDVAKAYVTNMSKEQIGDIQNAREASYITENLDVATLSKMKFLSSGATGKEMTARITKFFSLESLYDYSKNDVCTAFSRTKRRSDGLMRDFWVKSAHFQFLHIDNPNPYNRELLKELVPKIRPFTMDEEHGLIKVAKALFNVGVTVIYQPKLEKLQVRGATMNVNNRPCIVLSNLYNNYPTLWFSLLHELYHVLFDYEEIKKQGYHISSDEGDLFLMNEYKADDFATNYLLNESRLNMASKYINSPLLIEKLAKQWGLHPSIIYAIYCYKDAAKWKFYKKQIPQMDNAISQFNTHPFERETLMESVEEIKELFNV